MRRLRRFLPPNEEVHRDSDDDHQNSSDDNQAMRHTVHSLGAMLHKRDSISKESRLSRSMRRAAVSELALHSSQFEGGERASHRTCRFIPSPT